MKDVIIDEEKKIMEKKKFSESSNFDITTAFEKAKKFRAEKFNYLIKQLKKMFDDVELWEGEIDWLINIVENLNMNKRKYVRLEKENKRIKIAIYFSKKDKVYERYLKMENIRTAETLSFWLADLIKQSWFDCRLLEEIIFAIDEYFDDCPKYD